MSCVIEVEMREIALLLGSVRLGVGRPIILEAVLHAYACEFGPISYR